ncbi:hypothetical protein BGZ51_000282, partial [Haplosporangium sp. Z 767]
LSVELIIYPSVIISNSSEAQQDISKQNCKRGRKVYHSEDKNQEDVAPFDRDCTAAVGKWVFKRLTLISNKRVPGGQIYIKWLFATWKTPGPVNPKRISIELPVSIIKTPLSLSREYGTLTLSRQWVIRPEPYRRGERAVLFAVHKPEGDAFMDITESLLQ